MAKHIYLEVEYRPSTGLGDMPAVRILNTGNKPVVVVMEEQEVRFQLLPGRNIVITGTALEKFT